MSNAGVLLPLGSVGTPARSPGPVGLSPLGWSGQAGAGLRSPWSNHQLGKRPWWLRSTGPTTAPCRCVLAQVVACGCRSTLVGRGPVGAVAVAPAGPPPGPVRGYGSAWR
jgi:hypothetical protein